MADYRYMGQRSTASKAMEDPAILPPRPNSANPTLEQILSQAETKDHTVDILLPLLAAVVWIGPASIGVRCGYSGLWVACADEMF